MIDITRETPVSLDVVAGRLEVTVKTVRNWTKRLQGPRLEYAKFGGKLVTTWQALSRFQQGDAPPQRKPTADERKRRRVQEAIERELREVHGI